MSTLQFCYIETVSISKSFT